MKYFTSVIVVFSFINLSLKNLKNDQSFKRKLVYLALVLYLTLLFSVTLVPFRPLYHYMQGGIQFNIALEPYRDIRIGHYNAVLETLSNILMMVPLGFFMKAYFNWRSELVIFIGLMLSFSIEFLQLFDHSRVSDITDIINNTLGTVLGVLIFYIFRKIYLKRGQRT